MCNSYDFLIFSDILYEARPFIKANCKAKIILHLTRPFDDFVPEDDKKNFTNLLRKALSTEKVTVVVPYRAYLYDACERGLDITKYVNIQASPFSPNIKNSYVQILTESNPNTNQTVAVFNRYFQEKLLIDAFQKYGIKYEILDFEYGGPKVLSKYKAIVHLPYTPAPNSLMENICNGVMIFVPTREFLQELHSKYSNKIEMSNFNRYLDLRKDQMSMIYECFDPYIAPYVTYFSNWKNLVTKLNNLSTVRRKIMKKRNKEFSIYQRQENSYYWKTLLGYGNENIQSIFHIDELPYCKMKTKEERANLRNKQRRIEIAARKKKKPSNKKFDNQFS
ncbi:hypothetical protein LY90DRAFT_510281 [Neocallimastix californiae]|uniref:Uncharacterized protein n=1 Tax=Neocallimastix californiae TaxID=1754190 RepID=A0A1Y2C297_9FUNG|nr:hypothetical protein LY90DRAFT_510281 [Neocallimastix californiae]|eukprot:ORY41160.1 hypothetical protein LY90DRAFT_510281 [Neocallimastix californiae]